MNKGFVKISALFSIVALAFIAGVIMFSQPTAKNAFATETCPDETPWIKVNSLSGTTYTYTPPSGYVVTDNCYKHSTYVHYGTGNTVTADEHCSWEWKGGWNGHWKYVCHQYDLSHASFKLEAIVEPTLTPTPTVAPTATPTPTVAVDPTATPTPTPTVAVDPTATPTPTPGVECQSECEPTATPTPTVAVEPTATPTNTPSNPGGPGDGRSDGRSDGLSSCPECTQAPQGQVLGTSAVLGASTMAKTGGFAGTLMNLYAVFGMMLVTAGYASYAKEKKSA